MYQEYLDTDFVCKCKTLLMISEHFILKIIFQFNSQHATKLNPVIKTIQY